MADYYNDSHVINVESGSSTFDFEVEKTKENARLLSETRFISFRDDKGNAWKFSLFGNEIEEDHDRYIIRTENLGYELINKVMNRWEKFPQPNPFEYYFNLCAQGTGWEIGINEISHMSRVVEYEGRATAKKRINELLNAFDNAEIDYQVIMHNSKVIKKVANIYRQRGRERSDVQLVYGDTVTNITKTVDTSDLRTAIAGVGKAKEGNEDVYFRDIEYDDGDFFTTKGAVFLRSRKAHQQYDDNEAVYNEDYWDYDTDNQDTLFKQTLAELKRRVQPKINYEVDLVEVDENLEVGDFVSVIDHDYNPPLYLKARVLEIDKCYSEPSRSKALFGNFRIVESSIDARIKKLQEQLNSLKIETPSLWVRYADDDQGNGISASPAGKKYMAVKTVINQPVPSDDPADYVGLWIKVEGSQGIPGTNKYIWRKYADTVSGGGMSDYPDGKAYIGMAYNKDTPTASNNPKDYEWFLAKGNDGQDGAKGDKGDPGATGNTGPKGEDGTGIAASKVTYQASIGGTSPPTGVWTTGIPSVGANQYLWTKTELSYTDGTKTVSYSVGKMGADGKDGETGQPGATGPQGPAGATGNGIKSIVEQYYISTSPTTQTGGVWSTTVPNNADPTKFVWRRILTTYTNGTTSTSAPALVLGMTGSYPIISVTEPVGVSEGQQWWRTDAVGNVTGFYILKGGKWQAQTIEQSLLNIVELNAIKITSAEIIASTLSGSKFINSGDYAEGNVTLNYVSEDVGVKTVTWKIAGDPQNGKFTQSPSGMTSISYSDATKNTILWDWEAGSGGFRVSSGSAASNNLVQSAVSPMGIAMRDYREPYGIVNLTYKDLMTIPTTAFSSGMYKSGFTEYDSGDANQPRYSRQNRIVQLTGAIKPTVEIAAGAQVTLATLPVGVRPKQWVKTIMQGSGMNRYLLDIDMSGNMILSRYGVTSQSAAGVGSWLNIAVMYVAGD